MISDFSEFLQVLKAKNAITEVIGSYLKLERRGNSYWACCPFHHEKTPSFTVNAVDGYYHCFGCGVSGDVIKFVQEYENVDFMQAVHILAERAHLEVPAFDDRSAERTAQLKRKKDRLSELMKQAARFYLRNLYSGQAERHLAYCAARRLSPTTMKQFGLGASLDYTALPAYLQDSGFTAEECVESGACVLTESSRLIDAQGGRLIIPIINQMDEVIAFGGRLLVKSDRAKYKNTKETLLFHKSNALFNINLVKKLRRTESLTSLVMVEGYMDAISLYQAGFRNVVASMGTSLTRDQARLCKRYADSVLISYDGDFAGQKANLRGLDVLKEEGLKVRVVPMPEGLDPDDVIRTSGAEGYRACLDAAMPLIDFRIHAAKAKYDLNKTDERRDFVREALGIVREAESETEKEELLKRLSDESGVSYSALFRDIEALPKEEKSPAKEAPPAEDDAGRERKAERFVLAACLLNKPYAEELDLTALRFGDGDLDKIAQYIIEGRKEGYVRAGGIFDVIGETDGELSEVLNLDYGDNLEGERAAKYFQDCVKTLKLRELESAIARATEDYKEAETEDERKRALERIDELTRKRNHI